MIEVDVSKLSNVLELLEEYKKQLDENNMKIVEEFGNLKKFWHDQKYINFESSFLLEKKRIIKNAENINSQINLYNYIKNKYNLLGNKIKCSLNNKDRVTDKLNSIIDDLNWMIERYNNLGNISFYPNANAIRKQKSQLMKLKESFESIKNNIEEKFNYIEEVENNIQEKIMSIKIEVFSLNNYEREV